MSARDEWVRFAADPEHGVEHLHARFVRHAYERHAHDGYALGMTERGSQRFGCRGREWRTQPGAVMTFNPAELHDGSASGDEGFVYRMLYVPAPLLRALLEEAAERPCPEVLFRAPMAVDAGAARALARAAVALADAGTDRLERWERLAAALALLVRRYAEPAPRLPVARADAALRRVREALHDRMAEDLSVAELAALAGMSRFRLTRSFRAAYGVPPSDYLRLARLEAAKRLLASGEPLAAVAAAVGFADQAHLTRRFRGAFGLTPGRFQAALGRA